MLAPGERILEIVPDEQDMIMQVNVRPMDADNVRVGQVTQRAPGRVRRPADALRRVAWCIAFRPTASRISAAARITSSPKSACPSAEIERLVATPSGGPDSRLSPGLPVEVVIPLRKRTALQYLLEPLSQTVWRSFREN